MVSSKKARKREREKNRAALLRRYEARLQRDDMVTRALKTSHGKRLLARAMRQPIRELFKGTGPLKLRRGRLLDRPALTGLSSLALGAVY